MIDTYKRLHRQEQESRAAAGLEPSKFGPLTSLVIGCILTLASWLAIFAIVAFIGALMS